MHFDFQKLQEIFDKIPEDAAEMLAQAVKGSPRVFVHGAGRSGLMMKAFAMRLAQAGFTVYAVGDCTTPAIEEKDILIAASASGKTVSVTHCASTAKAAGAFVFSITASPDSELAKLSDKVIFFSAPTKDCSDSQSMMGTLFEEALLLFLDSAVGCLGADAAQMRARHANLE